MRPVLLLSRPQGVVVVVEESAALALSGWPAAWRVKPGGALRVVVEGEGPATFVYQVVMEQA